jgi:hypothetical protein
MSIDKIDNIFSKNELAQINKIIKDSPAEIHEQLGRKQVLYSRILTFELEVKLTEIAKQFSNKPLNFNNAAAVEYSPLYGKPNLPPHLDGDANDLIITIQLASNTVWDIGLNLQTYTLNDNSALVFNPNEEIHWRTHKQFKEGEYVRMLFVRFCNEKNLSDYSHLRLIQDDPMFKDAIDFRDSCPQINKA